MKLVRAMPVAAEAELEELRMLHALNRQVDSIIEESLREHASLTQTFHRLLPVVMREAGAQGVAVTTRNEELVEETFHTGDFGGVYPGTLLAGALGTRREGEGTVVSQELDVVGQSVGRIGLYLVGDHTRPEHAGRLERLLDTVAEQLDTVLMLVQTASEKQELILQLNRLLANPVFEVGMDQVVLA
ncbi:MAG TPA: adenylate/guanylate cyclase domain-containing protein, partial [Archangium sp.]